MKLLDYLARTGTEKAVFAKKIGISRQALYNLLNGAQPKLDTLRAIEKKTDGAVALKDWPK